MIKRFNNKCYKKAKVIKDKNIQLRVLYKKVGQAPQVKIINDIENFKKFVVLDKLDIIPYKHAFIICNNQNYKMQMPINIFFSLYHIAGNLVVVNIDKEKREFKSLTQDQLLYYSKDLMVREPNEIQNNNNYNTRARTTKNDNYIPFERDIETDNFKTTNLKVGVSQIRQTSFENSVIHILVNIELMLANLLKNNNYGDNEDE